MAMVKEAERQGSPNPGGTIFEATAGKCHRWVFAMPDKLIGERARLAGRHDESLDQVPLKT